LLRLPGWDELRPVSEPPLRVRGLTKRYAGRSVLDNLDLDLEAGQTVALTGPNGAGKSTLLGCVVGTVIPDAGQISIAGHDLAAEPIAARRALRYLAQEVDLPAGLTGRELIEFHADVFGEPAAIERAVALADLGPAIDRLATTYSVGMRRRLAFACLVPGPGRLYVLDEPFAGVDSQARVALLVWLAERRRAGAGILLAAHEESEGPAIAALEARTFPLGLGASGS
jgi:ABC-type multidrug transport system ATPase subunit